MNNEETVRAASECPTNLNLVRGCGIDRRLYSRRTFEAFASFPATSAADVRTGKRDEGGGEGREEEND